MARLTTKKPGPKTSGKKTHSLQAAADVLGIHRNTLSTWIKSEGCPTEQEGAKGIDWEICIPDVVAWMEQRAVSKALEKVIASAGNASGGTYGMTEEEADRLASIVDLQLKKIKLDDARKAVVRVDVIGSIVGRSLAKVRQKLMAIPPGVAPKLVGKTEAGEIVKIIREATDRALGELSDVENWRDELVSGIGGDSNTDA